MKSSPCCSLAVAEHLEMHEFLLELWELSWFPSPRVPYTVYLPCRFLTGFECISLLCCEIKEYCWEMVRKSHVVRLHAEQEVCVKHRIFLLLCQYSIYTSHNTLVYGWDVLVSLHLRQRSFCCSWSTFLQLCRHRQVITDKSFSEVILVFILCATYPLPNDTTELISSELSSVPKTMTTNVTEHGLSFGHKAPR